jgi:hypothetical protein
MVNVENYDMKLATVKCCFIYKFTFTFDDVAELKTV